MAIVAPGGGLGGAGSGGCGGGVPGGPGHCLNCGSAFFPPLVSKTCKVSRDHGNGLNYGAGLAKLHSRPALTAPHESTRVHIYLIH